MGRAVPVKIKMYLPTTDALRRELAQRVSEVHADFVSDRLKELTCPAGQKKALADAILAAAQSREHPS